MRYLILALALLVAVPTFATKQTSLRTANKGPDCLLYDLHTRSTAASLDTLAATDDVNIYGPFNLVARNGDPMPTTIQFWADVITGTTPEMSLDYQVISGFALADTVNAWTALDTLSATVQNASLTIAGTGKAIVFRVNNYDATESVVPGMLRIAIKSAITTAIKR